MNILLYVWLTDSTKRALEILQSQSSTAFDNIFASLGILYRMLRGRLPQTPKTYEETKEDLRKKYSARGRSRRIGGAKRPGRNYKKEVYELPSSGTRSNLSLSLPLDTSQDEEILDSIEVKSSLDTAASPSASEGAYPSGYSFSTGDDPSSNTSPSSPFSETVTLTAPTYFPTQKENQLGLLARPSEAPGCKISIPIPAPISSLKATGIATRSLASHIFIKSETPQSDGQPRRSQRPKGLDGLIVTSTEAKPSLLRSGISSTIPRDPCYVPTRRTHDFNSILRTRELGLGKWYGPQVDVKGMNVELGTHIARDLACWRSWTGASKDIVATAWAPDGCIYALGASTDMDNLNIQYNRPNNLLVGNNEANTLTELPDHFIDRPRPETIGIGENSLEGTYNSVDPELYTTVSHVCFGHTSDRLYSASFDKTVKIWDLDESGRATCVETLRHESNVELLSLSHQSSNLLATCQRTLSASIRIYDLLDSKPWVSLKTTLESPRAKKVSVYPTSLLAGTSPETSHLVLAGFSENSMEEKHDREGDLCLWDVRTQSHFRLMPSSQAILDLAWHPHSTLFAAASAPGSRMDLTNRWAKSVIRTYTPLETASRIMEYECPAVDINEIHFHPFDDHYISAGCTDGITYVWDVRMPENILHELRHDKPIDELDPTRTREDQDTGVRFTAWDKNGLDLYTGSSDGKIKVWNIFASPEDCHVRDVAQFDGAVMTGKFSPDSSNLIVGLSKGAVHILSTCPTTHDPKEEDWSFDTSDLRTAYETIRYIPATNPADDIEPSGAELADELLSSGQITMHPIFGAGKGPYYKGPFAAYARLPGTDPEMEDLDADILASQLDPIERKRGRRKGGKLDTEARVRYREANKVAEARNGPYRFREGKRKPPKREIEYDSIRVEDRVVYDGETIRVGVAGLKVREVKPIKEEQVKRPRQRGSTQSSSGRGSMRGSQKGRKGHQYWGINDIIVIDEDD
jgi:WD40 repeat protein